MLKHEIIISLNNVATWEQEALRDYLESNCWGWKEEVKED